MKNGKPVPRTDTDTHQRGHMPHLAISSLLSAPEHPGDQPWNPNRQTTKPPAGPIFPFRLIDQNSLGDGFTI
jgi:hypothetical protein